ncbi:MAG: hypothetical protein AAF958_04425 [Planctomycetota bacterium]
MVSEYSSDSIAWLNASHFETVDAARARLQSLARFAAPEGVLQRVLDRFGQAMSAATRRPEFQNSDRENSQRQHSNAPNDTWDPNITWDLAWHQFNELLTHTDDPSAWLIRLADQPLLLERLSRVLVAAPGLATRAVDEPNSLECLAASPRPKRDLSKHLVELHRELDAEPSWTRAATAVRHFYLRRLLEIGSADTLDEATPSEVGAAIAAAADAIIEATLQCVTRRMVEMRGLPRRPDGNAPTVVVLATGDLGGQEMTYTSPFPLMFLFDWIDHRNVHHRNFFETLVGEVTTMLGGDPSRHDGLISVDLRGGPRFEVGGKICGFFDAVRIFETGGRLTQRLRLIKARPVAGSLTLGESLIQRLNPWIYQSYLSRADLGEAAVIRRRMGRPESPDPRGATDLASTPGGRKDLHRTVGFLQLMHGRALPSVQRTGTMAAIESLQAAKCLSIQEAGTLLQHDARLHKLQNRLWTVAGQIHSKLPSGETCRRVAVSLGLPDDQALTRGLAGIVQENIRVIDHLMAGIDRADDSAAAESELVLDPDPDPQLIARTMRDHGLKNESDGMAALRDLSTETVRFLSPHRCRHFFSLLAPALLDEITRTPDPDRTLQTLVRVTDSLGAKASLWELLGANRPTMRLLVRMCAATPYLTRILIDNPGMIDELVDSLLIGQLPPASRLDAHSIELCRNASDIDLILRGFKASAHLTIGVRDLLQQETAAAIYASIADVADACVRRSVADQSERLASQYGDPSDEAGRAMRPLVLALGKWGGREPNYHSDLPIVFLFAGPENESSPAWQTKRRVGGPRHTTTLDHFFHELAGRVITQLDGGHNQARLFEASAWIASGSVAVGDARRAAISLRQFESWIADEATPPQAKLAMRRCRLIEGNVLGASGIAESLRDLAAHALADAAVGDQGEAAKAALRGDRAVQESTSHPSNLKRGRGGTLDVECIADWYGMKAIADDPTLHRLSTSDQLTALGRAGVIEADDAEQLVRGYALLRQVEGRLRLMDRKERHNLPSDETSGKDLAYLLGRDSHESVSRDLDQARENNRALLEKYLGRVSNA